MNSFHRITELCVLHVAKALHPLFLNNTTDLSLSVSFSFTVTQYLTFSSPRSVFFQGIPSSSSSSSSLSVTVTPPWSADVSHDCSSFYGTTQSAVRSMFLCSSFCLRQLLCNSAEHVMKTTSDWVIASCYGIYFYWPILSSWIQSEDIAVSSSSSKHCYMCFLWDNYSWWCSSVFLIVFLL